MGHLLLGMRQIMSSILTIVVRFSFDALRGGPHPTPAPDVVAFFGPLPVHPCFGVIFKEAFLLLCHERLTSPSPLGGGGGGGFGRQTMRGCRVFKTRRVWAAAQFRNFLTSLYFR